MIKSGIVAAVLIISLIVLNRLKKNEATAEWFTRNVSEGFVEFGGRISSLFPWFSLFEVSILVLILLGIALIVRTVLSLMQRRFFVILRGIALLTIAVLAAVNYYTVCAGFAYYRAELQLPMAKNANEIYRGQTVLDAADWFYNDFSALSERMERYENGDTVSPYTLPQLTEKLREEFKRLDGNDYFFNYTPRAKTIQNSWFMSSTGISGIAFLPTGEPNVNMMPHQTSLPQTMAHEIAHTKGIMRETDANLVSYYILITSGDDYLRYCGYLETLCYYSYVSKDNWMRRAAVDGNNLDPDGKIYSGYREKHPAAAKTEEENIFTFWSEYKSPFKWADDLLKDAGNFFNDLYLKLSGVKDGTDSYPQPPSGSIDTGQQNPDTGEKILNPVYNDIQKIFFKIYEGRTQG